MDFDFTSFDELFSCRRPPGKGKEGAISIGETTLTNEGQHVPPPEALLERRLRGLAVLHRRREANVPPTQASKPDAPRVRRVDGVGGLRAFFLLLTSSLAPAQPQEAGLGDLRGGLPLGQRGLGLPRLPAPEQEETSVKFHPGPRDEPHPGQEPQLLDPGLQCDER